MSRLKLLILGSGELAVARCERESHCDDLALLVILSRSGSGACHCSHASVALDVQVGAQAVCIGNPSEFDLEKGGKITFTPPLPCIALQSPSPLQA